MMTNLKENQRKITSLLEKLAVDQGIRPTILDGVRLMRADTPHPRSPVLYDPSIVIVGRGRKRGYIGSLCYVYDPHNYLVLSVPMPFECETEIGPDGPMLGVSVRVDVAVVGELLLKMKRRPVVGPEDGPLGMCATPLDEKMTEAVVRLLECLQSPDDAQILGPQIMREITYHVLCGKHGAALQALITMNSNVGQIQRALHRMQTQLDEQIDIATLADEAGMSPSSFHHIFKSVTATSPLQYLKTIRLHKARMLMVHQGLSAGEAAIKVGYESSSQFSREFKRFFGASPIAEANAMRERLGIRELESAI
ncbi:MAG: AraC family transcriptional regulator [Candidatus Obscuribacterales bacterium]|nr:AraC family transcriptional regulator [Candidatus Obscuribacterales bacterium]